MQIRRADVATCVAYTFIYGVWECITLSGNSLWSFGPVGSPDGRPHTLLESVD